MEFVGKHRLVRHPDHPPAAVRRVEVNVSAGDRITLTYAVEPAASLILPEHGATRTDGLWRSTCFELFAKAPDATGYREFNFAPGGAWNAYSFVGWREGMQPLDLCEPPQLARRSDASSPQYEFDVVLGWDLLGTVPASLSVTTILEEADGTMSYWALAHPAGEPDFHHPACFAATLNAIAAR